MTAQALARDTLARQQAELVHALVTGGVVPSGFDAARMRMAENALLRKRCGEVARHMPVARAQLGEGFVCAFLTWARGRERGGSVADAKAFTAYLKAENIWTPPRRPRWWRSS